MSRLSFIYVYCSSWLSVVVNEHSDQNQPVEERNHLVYSSRPQSIAEEVWAGTEGDTMEEQGLLLLSLRWLDF